MSLARVLAWLLEKGIYWIFGIFMFGMMWVSMWLGRVFREGIDYGKKKLIFLPALTVLLYIGLVIYAKQYWACVVLVLCGFGYTGHSVTRTEEWKEDLKDAIKDAIFRSRR